MRFSKAVVLGAIAAIASAVNIVEPDGQNFIDTRTGQRFTIIGVAYQPGGASGYNDGSDPLSNPEACLRDAALIQQLGVGAADLTETRTRLLTSTGQHHQSL